MQTFVEFLEDDFDTVSALTVLFDVTTYINSGIDAGGFTSAEVGAIHDLLVSFDEVLAVMDFCPFDESCVVPDVIQ